MVYFLFGLGFIFLIKGADILVDGASSIARRFGISSLVIGLTIIAFGTSAPELVVNIISSFKGSNDIGLGNILGSNIANILLILGISAMIFPLSVKHGTTWKEIPYSLLAIFAVTLVANDIFIDHAPSNVISRIDASILMLFFVIFAYYTFGISKDVDDAGGGEEIKDRNMLVSFVMIFFGIVGLTLGGQWIVDGAIYIARQFALSEAFIGLTIVAVGTSLPELATSAVAAYKKNSDIAIGNIVGSNIFNLLWVLPVSAFISPITISSQINFDFLMVIVATVLLFVNMFVGKRHTITRREGGVFVLLYIAYVVFLIFRG